MKTISLPVITVFSFLSIAFHSYGQTNNPYDSSSFQNLQKNLNLLVEQAGQKKVVAMGEGTHGTKEFNEIRNQITKALIKEQAFNYVLFESNYGDATKLNSAIQNRNLNLDSSMKESLTSIYQTREIKGLLEWITTFNEQAQKPISVGGLDYAQLGSTFHRVRELFSNYEIKNKSKTLNELQKYVSSQDAIWNNLNNPKAKFPRKKWIADGVKAYALIEYLESALNEETTINPDLETALLNLKIGFETIHLFTTQKKDASRDSCMAEMVKIILKNDPGAKIVIWAHNAHIAKNSVYENTNGGGMGGFILRTYPKDYYAIATLTSTGTFSATNDRVPTRFNKFTPATLEEPIEGSLEKNFGKTNQILFTETDNTLPNKTKMRFIGYGPHSDANTFAEVKPKALYDAIIYLERTNAAEHLNN